MQATDQTFDRPSEFDAKAYLQRSMPFVEAGFSIEVWLDLPIEKGLAEREKRADQLIAWDDEVAAVVQSLKAKGLESPYLKNFVVARVNFLRFKKDTSDLEFEATIEELMFTIHAHPTLAEAMLDGFGSVENMAINV